MKFYPIPTAMRNTIRTTQRVAIYTVFANVLLLLFAIFTGAFPDVFTGLFLSVVSLSITTSLLIPGLKYGKISMSEVHFSGNEMQIFSARGMCWRTVSYEAITAITVENVQGFFYGRNHDLWKNDFICIFLNGTQSMPEVSFKKKFTSKEFIMIAYCPEVMNLLQQVVMNRV